MLGVVALVLEFLYNGPMKRGLLVSIEVAAAMVIIVVYFLLQPSPVRVTYTRVLCMGDSLTESSYGQYTRHLGRLFKAENLKVNVYSAARPGNTSGEYLDYLSKSKILKKINPHILVLMLGTNDVRIDGDSTPVDRFEKNMREIIGILHRFKARGGSSLRIFIMTIPPIFNCDLSTFSEVSRRRIAEESVPTISKLAREEDIHLIDLFEFFKKRPELLPGVHPGEKGYRAMAEFIFTQIRPYVNKGAT